MADSQVGDSQRGTSSLDDGIAELEAQRQALADAIAAKRAAIEHDMELNERSEKLQDEST